MSCGVVHFEMAVYAGRGRSNAAVNVSSVPRECPSRFPTQKCNLHNQRWMEGTPPRHESASEAGENIRAHKCEFKRRNKGTLKSRVNEQTDGRACREPEESLSSESHFARGFSRSFVNVRSVLAKHVRQIGQLKLYVFFFLRESRYS